MEIDSTLTSGTLYSTAALLSVGGFRESYFIDFVDHECHLRLRRAGWKLWWVPGAVLYHDLGKTQRLTAQGLWIEHEPYRYYYMARNMLEGHRRLGGMGAALLLGAEIARHAWRLQRYGRRPALCAAYIGKGILHAMLGKSGRLGSAG